METPNSNSEKKYKSVKYFIIYFLFISFFSNVSDSKVVYISVQDNKFSPDYVHVSVGDVIHWSWNGPSEYSILCDGQFPGTTLPIGASGWNILLNNLNPVSENRISVSGIYTYVCSNSLSMTGSIIADITLPVELTDFVATTIKNEVILDWATGGEVNNDRFEIQRIEITNMKDFNPDDLTFVTIGVLNGNGTSNSAHEYKFIDRNLKSGKYLYRLKQVDYNGNYIFHLYNDIIIIGIPNKFIVNQNYPNPFNPTTRINYELPEDGNVQISLFDINGKEVGMLFNDFLNAGYQSLEFNGAAYSTGVYYYRINFKSNNTVLTKTKKMMLIK